MSEYPRVIWEGPPRPEDPADTHLRVVQTSDHAVYCEITGTDAMGVPGWHEATGDGATGVLVTALLTVLEKAP